MAAEGGLAPATVLVTGAAGGLGAAAVRAIRGRGARVRALVHERPVPEADEQVRGDLADSASLEAALAGADAVVHMAAITHARRAADYFAVNVEGTRHLLAAATRAGAARFVLVSSRTAVSGAGAYGESKLEAERLLAASTIPFVILRPAEVLGAGGSEGVDDILDRARRNAAIRIVGRGEDIVCPASVPDVAAAVAAAVDTPAALGRTYVLGGEPMTVAGFVGLVRSRLGSSSRVIAVPTPVVACAAFASRALPLPIYPDQLRRLRAAKPGPSPEAGPDLGFEPGPVASWIE